jgi:hypothetical protein
MNRPAGCPGPPSPGWDPGGAERRRWNIPVSNENRAASVAAGLVFQPDLAIPVTSATIPVVINTACVGAGVFRQRWLANPITANTNITTTANNITTTANNITTNNTITAVSDTAVAGSDTTFGTIGATIATVALGRGRRVRITPALPHGANHLAFTRRQDHADSHINLPTIHRKTRFLCQNA